MTLLYICSRFCTYEVLQQIFIPESVCVPASALGRLSDTCSVCILPVCGGHMVRHAAAWDFGFKISKYALWSFIDYDSLNWFKW